MEIGSLSLSLAFIAGIASFLSPCVFSLVPAYIGYLGGRSAASATRGVSNRFLTLSHGIAFVLGFSAVFITLGLATSAIGGLLFDLRSWLARIGGLVVIFFGLHMTGILRIPFLEYDLRMQNTPNQGRGYLASFLMGVFFSAGWSPCVGPVLGAILTLSLSGGSIAQGAGLLAAYSAGLAIPFLIASTQIGLVTEAIRKPGRFEQLARYGSFFTSIDEVAVGRLLLIGVLVLAGLGLISAAIASRKGRNFFDWWVFGAGLFPVALYMALRLPTQASTQPPAPESYPGAG